MSRIGNNPVKLPPKVEVTLAAGEITVKGPLGTLTRNFGETVSIEKDGDQLVFKAIQTYDNKEVVRWIDMEACDNPGENGIDLTAVAGTGVGGRIRKDDVLAAVKAGPAPAPALPLRRRR